MARIVGPGRKLVDHEPSFARDEELDAQHAHNSQPLENAARHVHGFGRNVRRHASWRDGDVQNVAAMLILDRAVVHELAISAARRHYRYFPIEIDKRFEY